MQFVKISSYNIENIPFFKINFQFLLQIQNIVRRLRRFVVVVIIVINSLKSPKKMANAQSFILVIILTIIFDLKSILTSSRPNENPQFNATAILDELLKDYNRDLRPGYESILARIYTCSDILIEN